ncbi:MAG: hypothetical protein ABI390_01330 [Daejeonella sp.]
MNFLSHYYFDRNSPDANQVLGSVLPDLLKNANKFWNLHPDKKTELYSDSEFLKSIHTGWQRHIFVDNYFHSSAFFAEHTRKIRTEIAPILINSKVRPFFLAHIGLEIMLDSLLLTRKIVNPHHFYTHLSTTHRPSVDHFLQINQIEDTQIFFNFLDKFIEINYLHSYHDAENIMFALNNICKRIWDNPLNKIQIAQLTAFFDTYIHELQISFMDIFAEIDEIMNIPEVAVPKTSFPDASMDIEHENT